MANINPVVIPEVGDPGRLVFDAGVEAGKEIRQIEILSILEKKYLHPSVTRNTPEGKAILEIAAYLSAEMKKK